MRRTSFLAGLQDSVVIPALAVLMVGSTACKNQDQEQPLVPESQVSRQLDSQAGETLTIDLESGQFLQLEVEQQGIDVIVDLSGPEGPLVSVDGLLGAAGAERLLWLAERSGTYRLEIRGTLQLPDSGYEIRLEEPRTATSLDRQKAAAALSYYEAGAHLTENALESADQKYHSSLEQWTAIGDSAWQAEVHHALGFLSIFEADPDAAMSHYRMALEMAADEAIKSSSRHNIASIHFDRDELALAREEYLAALAGWELLPDRYSEASAANDLGLVSKYLREVSEALRYYDRALELYRKLGATAELALTLQNRGRAYTSQGKAERALDDLNEALEIYAELEDSGWIAIVRNGIGHALRDLGELDEARKQFELALGLQDSEQVRAAALVGIGEIYFLQDEPSMAEESYREALQIFRQLEIARDESYVLRALALLGDSSDPDQAATLYRESLVLAHEINDREQQAESLLGLARAERNRSNLLLAKDHAEAALTLVEQLRQRGAVGTDLRSAYFAKKQNYYDFYIRLLMDLSAVEQESEAEYVAMALSASERSRARSLLESLIAADSEPNTEADPLVRRQKALRRSIETKQVQVTQLLSKPTEEERVAAVKRDLRADLEELEELDGRLRELRPLHAQVTDPSPLSAAEIRQSVLAEDTLLLEYQLGEESSFVWAMTSNSLNSYELPSQAVVEKLAREASRLLDVGDQTVYQNDIRQDLSELGDLLLRPVKGHLNKARVLVVAEGALQYIPFAALPHPDSSQDAAEPLVARHEIVSLPSASLLHALRNEFRNREVPTRDLAVIADPVFDLKTGGNDSEQFARLRGDSLGADDVERPERLPYAALEAQKILELAAGRSTFEALGIEATKESVRDRDLRDYRYIHIATHGLLNTQFPELSSLVFSLYDREGRPRDGYLRLHEVYQLELLADLVVLSACRTARGREVRGEGIVGWTQGFMYSGAKRVLVSLWSVDDEATAELMGAFYDYLLTDQLSPAAALRRAQNTVRETDRWREPYYWAGFILQGEYL